MKTAFLIFFCAGAIALAGEPPAAPAVTKDNALSFYLQFKRLTKQPHKVAPITSGACAPGFTTETPVAKGSVDPHFHAQIHVYVNAPADDVITRKLYAFPQGAVIVKEKLNGDGSVSGVGGMIKRAPGFNPKDGDWEYFYAEKTGGFFSGRLQSCITCHADSKHTDFVFGVWKDFD